MNVEPEEISDTKETNQETLNDIVESKSRWDVIRGLKTWRTKLSAGDIEALKKVVQKTTHNDWEMNYSARLLLRQKQPDQYDVSPEVAAVEEMFIQMRGGKVTSGTYDNYLDDIIGMSSDIVPMLLEMLNYGETYDFYRKDIAIKALGKIQDERIIPALKNSIISEKHRNQLEQMLMAILNQDSSDAMVDYAASVIAGQESSFDQEYIIRFLSQSNMPYKAKKRLYSHYAEYKNYGKHAVLRGYDKMDDQDTFNKLVQILREEKFNTEFRMAVYTLNRLKISDPSPVFLEFLKISPDHACDDLIIVLAERNYLPAITILEERMMNVRDSVDGQRCKVWAAGALCKLGKD